MGKTYSVDKLLALTRNAPVVQFQLNKLTWMIDDDYDLKRMRAVDTTVPVLVYKLKEGTWVTMDGYHRVIKACYIEHKETIPAKIVTEQMFQQL